MSLRGNCSDLSCLTAALVSYVSRHAPTRHVNSSREMTAWISKVRRAFPLRFVMSPGLDPAQAGIGVLFGVLSSYLFHSRPLICIMTRSFMPQQGASHSPSRTHLALRILRSLVPNVSSHREGSVSHRSTAPPRAMRRFTRTTMWCKTGMNSVTAVCTLFRVCMICGCLLGTAPVVKVKVAE